jgi:hypothetical protein
MKKTLIQIISFMVLVAGFTATNSIYGQTPYNRNYNRQAVNLIINIQAKTNALKSIMNRGSYGGYNNNNSEISSALTDFETTTSELRQKLNSRQEVSSNDVEEVLNRANSIENYMNNNRSSSSVKSQWNSIKTDLNSLARVYNVSWN